jgi:hypothetical protein
MQTFLPYANFKKSLQCLDYKRLGKQRVEAYQIHKAITLAKQGRHYGWQSHPCVSLWYEHQTYLAYYYNLCIDEWVKRGYKNTMDKMYDGKFYTCVRKPHWLGNKKFHDSHKSNLLRKDKNFYSKYKWNISDNLEYYWAGYAKKEQEDLWK